jgi:hypothetical protein
MSLRGGSISVQRFSADPQRYRSERIAMIALLPSRAIDRQLLIGGRALF